MHNNMTVTLSTIPRGHSKFMTEGQMRNGVSEVKLSHQVSHRSTTLTTTIDERLATGMRP